MKTLFLSYYLAPIAKMLILCDEKALYLLEFEGRKNLEKDISHLLKIKDAKLIQKETPISLQLTKELDLYFSKKLKEFSTPIHLLGTPFQIKVWKTLQKIPFGTTKSYKEEALLFGKEKAIRAIASANGKNRLAIIIPCHRVIHHNGKLGGYGGGIDRKKWLLQHETIKSEILV